MGEPSVLKEMVITCLHSMVPATVWSLFEDRDRERYCRRSVPAEVSIGGTRAWKAMMNSVLGAQRCHLEPRHKLE